MMVVGYLERKFIENVSSLMEKLFNKQVLHYTDTGVLEG